MALSRCLRFIALEPEAHPNSGEPRGLFALGYDLLRSNVLASWEEDWFRRLTAWFDETLPRPRTFRATRRHGAKNVAISWFKPTATEHLARMRELASLLESHGVLTRTLASTRPGYVVYEDAFQVVVLPFRGR